MDIVLLAMLVIVVYLIVLNGFLNGRMKTKIDAALSCVLLGIIAVQFSVFDWRTGLTGVAVTLLAAWMVHPVARVTARFLYAHPPLRR
jgi:uncharacterized membrane protein